MLCGRPVDRRCDVLFLPPLQTAAKTDDLRATPSHRRTRHVAGGLRVYLAAAAEPSCYVVIAGASVLHFRIRWASHHRRARVPGPLVELVARGTNVVDLSAAYLATAALECSIEECR